MMDNQLDSSLSHYQDALDELEKGALKNFLHRSPVLPSSWVLLGWLSILFPLSEEILSVLVARDAVRIALANTHPIPRPKIRLVTELDERLKRQAKTIARLIPLDEWRRSFHPHPEAWWWFFEPPLHPLDRLDWLWNALTVTSLVASLSLVVDISSKFLTVEPGLFGSFAVIAQSVLTLFTAGSTLTKAGQTAIEKGLSRLGIPTYWRQEVKLGLSGLLLLGLFGFRNSLPQISAYYNQQGVNNYETGEWSSAIANYERALSLDPDNAKAHYNLGVLYEDLQDFEKASTQYRLAAQGDFIASYNNLARLYIKEQKLAEAASLLWYGLERVQQDNDLKSALFKNLGWVRLNQQRYGDAEAALRDAIALSEASASAHCLLAQALEKQRQIQAARLEWELCLSHADQRIPEEDTWLNLARQSLEGQKSNDTSP
jgi:tetratricopeptide (TPR) repeat protein